MSKSNSFFQSKPMRILSFCFAFSVGGAYVVYSKEKAQKPQIFHSSKSALPNLPSKPKKKPKKGQKIKIFPSSKSAVPDLPFKPKEKPKKDQKIKKQKPKKKSSLKNKNAKQQQAPVQWLPVMPSSKAPDFSR
ncbi:MAG: hypothetical protein AAF518_05570 [Spirochaetota bacterium]